MNFDNINPNTSPINVPPLWKVNPNNNCLVNSGEMSKCITALNFFIDHSQWAQENPDTVKQYATLLARTNFEDSKLSDQIRKVEQSLNEKLPELFPMVLVKIGEGHEQKILQSRLEELSPKFKQMLASGMQETREKVIVVHPPSAEIEDSTIKIFLNFLSAGEGFNFEKDLLNFIALALENDLHILANAAAHFILRNQLVDFDNIVHILNFSVLHEFDSSMTCKMLNNACLGFANEHLKDPHLLSVVDNADLTPEGKNLINLVFQMDKLPWHIKFFEELTIESIDDEMMTWLKLYFQKVSLIEDIKVIIKDRRVSEKDLEQLSSWINIKELKVSADIKSIPVKCTQKLKKLDVSGCTSLQHLNAAQTESIVFDNCTSLETLIAPNAKNLKGKNCESLKQLDVPEAETIAVRNAVALVSLNAPKAESVNVKGCTSLKDLNAPKASKIVRE